MLKVTVTTYGSPVTVQDPRPVNTNSEEQAVITVEANSTKTVLMQYGQLERMQGQLTKLAREGLLTFVIESGDYTVVNGEIVEVAGFAELADAPTNPSIDLVETVPSTGGSTGVDLVGDYLLNGQVMASASVAGDADAGSVTLEVLNPGYAGNLYDIVVVDSGGAGPATLTDAEVDGRTVLTLDLVGVTVDCDGLKTLVDANYAGVIQATVVDVGGTNISVQDLQAFTGGEGTGLSVTLGGLACTVTAIVPAPDPETSVADTITVTTPAVGAAGQVAKFRVRSDAKEDLASVVLGA